MVIRPSAAEVPVQNLIDHTGNRLFLAIPEKVAPFLGLPGHFTIVYKWGGDGMSNNAQYKMTFTEKVDGEIQAYNDSHVFLMCLVPLRVVFNAEDGTETIVWNNNLPSSVSLCRVIKMIFQKETAEMTKREINNVKEQFNQLSPTMFYIDNHKVIILTKEKLSMVDGKVLNDITDTNSQSCHLCKKSGKALNDPLEEDDDDDDEEDDDSESDYEILPTLHAYIRTMEHLLNISYKLDVKKWRVSKDDPSVNERRARIRGISMSKFSNSKIIIIHYILQKNSKKSVLE